MAVFQRSYGLIRDPALFRASEFLVDDKRYETEGKKVEDIRQDLYARLKHAEGRYRFWVHETKKVVSYFDKKEEAWDPETSHDDRGYVTLRVDPSNYKLSLDVHNNIRRTDWWFSWQSTALFSIDHAPKELKKIDWASEGWSLLAVGKVFPSEKYSKGLVPDQMTLALRLGKNKHEIEAARLVVLRTGQTKAAIQHDFSMCDPGIKYYQSLRYFTPRDLVAQEMKDTSFGALVEDAVGPRGGEIGKLLSESKSGIFWEDRKNGLEYVQGTSAHDMLARYQWTSDSYTFTVLFADRDLKQKNTMGVVPSLNYPDLTHRHRHGAIVYVGSVVHNYLNHHEKGYSEPDRDALIKKHRPALIERIRHTYIHELGHLLNLPHTWERGHFDAPRLQEDPAAVSWMGYGSRFPLGGFMDVARAWRAEVDNEIEDDLRLSDSEKVNASILSRPGFAPEEEIWIKHAPFDHVSPGGPYFTRRAVLPHRYENPTEKLSNGFRSLEIHLLDVETEEAADLDGLPTSILTKGGHTDFPHQPLFGYVELKVTREFADRYPIHFAFQSPMLNLFARAEYPDLKTRNAPRRILPYPVKDLPSDWIVNEDDPRANVSEHFHHKISRYGVEKSCEEDEKLCVFRRRIPVFQSRFFERFGEETDDFTLQAVVRPAKYPGWLYSPQVPIRFVVNGKRYSQAEAKILRAAEFETLFSILEFIPDHDLEALARPKQHKNCFEQGFLTKLIGDIRRHDGISAVSPNLFVLLGKLFEAIDCTCNEKEFNTDNLKGINSCIRQDLLQFTRPARKLNELMKKIDEIPSS